MPSGNNIRSLRDIEKRQWQELAAKVRTANGKVIVLVHPFFYTKPGMDKFEASVVKTLRQSKTPVVILVEQEKIRERQARLEALGVSGRHLILPTGPEDPKLVLKTTFIRRRSFEEKQDAPGLIERVRKDGAKKAFTALIGRKPVYEKPGNPMLIEILKRAGAKRVFVGGIVAQAGPRVNKEVEAYERRWLPRTRVPSEKTISKGCAGGTYKNLIGVKEFTRVRMMPTMSHPDKPHYPLRQHRK